MSFSGTLGAAAVVVLGVILDVFLKPYLEDFRKDPKGSLAAASLPLSRYFFLPLSIGSSLFDLWRIAHSNTINTHVIIRVAADCSLCVYGLIFYFISALFDSLEKFGANQGRLLDIQTDMAKHQAAVIDHHGALVNSHGALVDKVGEIVKVQDSTVQALNTLVDWNLRRLSMNDAGSGNTSQTS